MIYPCYVHIILLQQACIDDDLDMVEFLVEQGADINRGDNEGWTPLHATASCGFISIAKLVQFLHGYRKMFFYVLYIRILFINVLIITINEKLYFIDT